MWILPRLTILGSSVIRMHLSVVDAIAATTIPTNTLDCYVGVDVGTQGM
jgi:hypothetical protein